jgi:CBS domain-containing protein
MIVRDLLTVKGREVATISKDRSVGDALAVLRDRGIGAVVVTGLEGPLVGIFSERDVVRALAEHGAATLDLTVADLMSATVTTCTDETSLNDLMSTMTDQHIRHVPVVDGGRLVGLVSIGDVVKARVDELEHVRRELLDYVNAR